jgi:hypothetical protein
MYTGARTDPFVAIKLKLQQLSDNLSSHFPNGNTVARNRYQHKGEMRRDLTNVFPDIVHMLFDCSALALKFYYRLIHLGASKL